MTDLTHAIRNFRRYPMTTIVAIASLAAGIGATTVTLSLRDVLYRKPPLAYRQPEQLSRVQTVAADRQIRPLGSPVPAPLYRLWSATLGSSQIAGTISRGQREVRTNDRSETVTIRGTTPALFTVLGVDPSIGYAPPALAGHAPPAPAGSAPSTSARDESRGAMLSYGAWHRLFDGRADVVGSAFWIDNQPYTVLGVLPQRFWFSAMDSPVWTLLDERTLASDEALEVVIRRPPGVTEPMLDAQLRAGLAEYVRQYTDGRQPWNLKVSGVEGTPVAFQMSIVLPYLLGMATLLTFLIACANVAILMIAQWTAREHEIAIRASIGASRGRIVRSLLIESTLIALCGATLGGGATLGLRAWVASRSGDGGFFNLSIDPAIFIQTAALALLAGVGIGIAPALYETRRLQANPLRAMAGADVVRQRWRHALVIFEIAVTVALLVVVASMIGGYQRAIQAEMGFDTHPLMTARVENSGGVPASRLIEAVAALPGVESAAASTTVPFGGGSARVQVAAAATGAEAVAAEQTFVSDNFFSSLGVQIPVGRGFEDADARGRGTALINEALARRLFEGPPTLFELRRVWVGKTSYDVVGVVADYSTVPLRTGHDDPKLFLPLPSDMSGLPRLQFLVRVKGNPAALVNDVRRVLRDAAPGTSVFNVNTIDQIVAISGQEILVGTAPLLPLISIGMLLTTAGIYGVLAFAIVRRARELAVRVAVGATGRDLRRLVMAHTARLVVIGALIGVAITFGLTRIVRSRGGAGGVFDPSVNSFLVPVLILFAIGLLASWLPARRAQRIDPVVLLRN
jgi:predicted permease